MPSAVGGYEAYVPPVQQQQRPDLSNQMQHMSLESPSSLYSPQQPPMPEHSAPAPPQQQVPPAQGGYQAYQPYQAPQQPQTQGQQGMAGGDPGDFYR